jgi:hypothetical protein
VGPAAIDVQVGGGAPLREICSVVPGGRSPLGPSTGSAGSPQRVERIGSDTVICADVTSQPSPVRARFALALR